MVGESINAILIVEDDPGIAELEKSRLERVGYRIVVAATADEAIRALRTTAVDLILLAYRLPGNIDGLDFFAQVRAAGFDLPVILVTGFSDEATVIRALRAGVREFATKSVDYLDFLPEAVGRVLQHVRTERHLAESDARLASIINSAKDAIIVADAQNQIGIFNTAAEQMFRCSAKDAIGQSVTRFIPNSFAESASSIRIDPVVSGSQTGMQGLRADGEVFPLETSVSHVFEGGRKFYTVVARDVTERTLAEARIREQAALLDQARDAILVRDMDDNILYWNRGAERLYGWTANEAVGHNANELFARLQSSERQVALQVVLEQGEWSGEMQQVAKDGRALTVESRRTLLRDAAGRPTSVLIINTDVTEKKKLEAQLHHAQRLEAIGVLASGVAHDFNNLLTIICGYSEMLQSQTRPSDPAHGLLSEILKAGHNATALTRQLLTFGRKQVLSPQILDPNELVKESEKMLRRLVGPEIELTTVLEPDVGSIKADPTQIDRVLINLVVNARDAMPNGGTIIVGVRNVAIDAETARRHGSAMAGVYVLLTVKDSGCGMDEATISRIFEPFFTTKEVGKGTGLGLAMVHGIVAQSGGHIEVESAPGKGTSFKIFLPRVEANAVGGIGPATAEFRSSETVLLVEDDSSIRDLCRLALRSAGYTVLVAANGEQALNVMASHSGRVHVLVTDSVISHMSGQALTKRLTRDYANLKVVYISGQSPDATAVGGVAPANAVFLQKPFAPGTLAETVRELLET